MGIWSSLKKFFTGEPTEDPELAKLRAKHGIVVDHGAEDVPEAKKLATGGEEYDPWEDIRNMRTNFWFGSWVTRRFRVIGEEKVKKELEELEKKRREEAARKGGGGLGK